MFYKRFLLFGMDSYYPAGGFHDYITSFDTFEQATEYWNTPQSSPFGDRSPAEEYDWGEVVDLETGVYVSLKEEKG